MTTIYITAKSETEARKIVEMRWPDFKYEIKPAGERWEVTLINEK